MPKGNNVSQNAVAAEVNLSYMNDEEQQQNDNIKDIESAGEKNSSDDKTNIKWKRNSNTTRIRCYFYTALVLLLFVAFITFLILYVTRKDDNVVRNILYNNTTNTAATCLDERCISRASEILKFMNDSVDPCDDFFSFACGRWQDETIIPPTETSINMFSLVQNNINEMLRNLIASDEIQEKYKKNRAVMKSFQLYQTCLSRTKNAVEDINYLKNIIDILGGSNLTTPSWNASNYNVFDAAAKALRDFGTQVFFMLDVYYDLKNATQRRFIILNGGLTLKKIFYLEQNSSDPFYIKTRQSYREYMVDVMTVLAGVDRQKAKIQMEEVFLFEEKLAQTSAFIPPLMNTIEELSNRTRHDWLTYFRNLTINQTYEVDKSERIILTIDDEFVSLIKNTDKAVLSNYIAWKILEASVDHLPDEYRQVKLTYDKKKHGDNFEGTEEWQDCIKFTTTHLPFAIGLIYVDSELTSETRARVKEILEEIRREFLLELESQTWMDDATRAKAKEKAELTTVISGYPDFIKDEEKLNEKYQNAIIIKEQYMKTVFGLRSFTFMDKVEDLRLPSDRKSFVFSPATVNAYYGHQQNKISFLAGIMGPPFFSIENIRASNYGGIGMIAGHELTHGFDSFGSTFDAFGNKNNWWSKSALDNFNKKKECLIEQYSNLTYFGMNVNGDITISENIADNGGLKFAYWAYRSWVKENGEESKLPGLRFTPNQLFFISFAQAWCSKYTREAATEQLHGTYAPNNIRVKGVLQNMEPFAEAFNCKPDSPMSPRKRCEFW